MQSKNAPVSNTLMLTLLATAICGDTMMEKQTVRDQLVDAASSPVLARRLVRIFDADPKLADEMPDVNLAARLTLAPYGVEIWHDESLPQQGHLLLAPTMH